MKIGIIGAGNMGSAIISSLLNKKIVKTSSLSVCDKNKSKLKRLACQTTTDIAVLIKKTDIIILAVKPQNFVDLSKKIKNLQNKKTLFISIMAGISLSILYKLLKTSHIIRAMPNTPVLVSKGMTVWIAGKDVSKKEKNTARKIFKSFGKEIEVIKEDLINAATSVSGSGPAYFAVLTEILEKKAEKMGFKKFQAELLASQTLFGTTELLKSGIKAETLRKNVASPGGTTQAALEILTERTIENAINAAYKRAKELGK